MVPIKSITIIGNTPMQKKIIHAKSIALVRCEKKIHTITKLVQQARA